MKPRTILAIFLLFSAGFAAKAENTWTVSNPTGSTFRITRSGDTSIIETVKYRTVSLSAIAGQHFTELSGEVTFNPNDTYKDITVTETTPAQNANDAYKYQTGAKRKYRFEVTDIGGFYLQHCDREITTGTSIDSDNVYAEKELVINSGTITVTDGGYAQAYHSVSYNDYYTAAAPKKYLVAAGAELRMTVTFNAREADDGYQYIQIYANTTADKDHTDTGAGDGNPGTINYSRYMAGFTIDGNVSSTYYPYTFPLTSKGSNCGSVAHPWANNSNGNLEQQYFNSNCRASDGRLIIPTDLSSLYIRLNASGHNNDSWYAQNVKAHIQAVDVTKPTVLAYSVAPGRHSRGNYFYVTVAFSEIVIASSSSKLTSNWGDLSYVGGSGSNVLTFRGTVPNNQSIALTITGCSGIADLAGKTPSSVGTDYICPVDGSYNYTITYNLDGGSVASANPTSYNFDRTAITLNNPTRPGYTFTGWTGSNGSTPQTSVTIPAHSHGNKSYTANWSINTYTITYEGLEGAIFETTKNSYTVDSPDITLDLPTKTGYSFSGWTGSNGDSPQRTVKIETGSTGDKTYTANWNPISYRVSFYANANAVSISGHMSPVEFVYDQEKALPVCTFIRRGFVFSGWGWHPHSEVIYTDGQVVSNLTDQNGTTVTLYAQWTFLWGDNPNQQNGSSEERAYVITSTAGLDLLADQVNAVESFAGYYFKLGYNIAYTHGSGVSENNFTSIGSAAHPFQGFFDGHGYSVSGIRICKEGDAGDYQGLFGYARGGYVKRVVLADAVITGRNNVGGIVGCADNAITMDGNVVIGATLSGASSVGAVIGATSGNDGTFTNNYYRNVTIEGSENVMDGVSSLHTITLPDYVTAGTVQVNYGEVDYYAAGSTVTLDLGPYAGEGDLFTFDCSLADLTVTEGTISFTMPAEDVVVTAPSAYPTCYIDENGVQQQVLAKRLAEQPVTYSYITLGETDNPDTFWYVVSGDVILNNRLIIYGDVRMILADGSTLTIGTLESPLSETCIYGPGYKSSLRIYSQSEGTGAMSLCSTGYAIGFGNSSYPFYFYGGSLSAHSTGNNAISCNGLYFGGGHLSFSTDKYGGRAVYIPNYAPITLCGRREGDSFFTGGYYYSDYNVNIAPGKSFMDESGNLYDSRTSSETLIALAGHTLTLAPPVATLTAREGPAVWDKTYWCTFYNASYAAGLPETACAYTMGSDGSLHLLGADGRVIPAGCAVLIVSSEISIEPNRITTDMIAPAGNVLRGVSADTPVNNVYVMSAPDGELGFYPFTGTLPAGKVYYTK